MALWSKVTNCDLDCETVSFGTRQFAQANGALYECSTLAVITPDSEEAKTPHIKSICCDSFIYLAIDNSFTILSGESCVHERSDIYEAPIDCFSVNKAMKMIILCFQNGQIFGLDVQDHALLFEVVLEHEGTYEGKAFITIVEEHEYCVIIASSGAAYRLSKDFDTSVESNHTKFSFEAVNDIKLNIPYPVAAVPGENNYSYVFGGQRIEIANYDDVFSVPMLNSKIKKMATVDGFSNIFCLLSDGTLNTLCYYSLYMSPRKLDYFVDDFVIIKTPDTDTCNLLMSCDNNKRLMLAEYPSMKEIYSIHVKNKIELIDFIDIPMDIKFIEYVGDSINCPEIRIRALVETHPELRVQRLITRGRFDEAETLVKQFKLSMDEINKAKATLELKKYWESVSNISDETFDKLISLLDSIKDNSCIADWCLQALHNEVCDTKSMKKLLHYVINRIKDHFELENYSKRFQDTLLRLETYNLLSLRMNIPWAQFRHKNYTQLYLSLLDSEDCMSAAAIFARHFDSICEDMTSNTVQIFLQKIPNIDPTHMLPCLRHFIPKFVQRIPSALQQIVDWVKRKTLSFEGCYKSLWPDIGRDFCEAILEILHMVDQDSNHPTVADSILDDLLTLNKSLEELIILKEQFSINCSSGRYMKNDFTDVALILMKQVPTNHIETFLKDFLIPRLCIRNIDLNDLLNKHISDCLKKRDKDQQWESKMCSFALHITDELVAMQCILKILKSAKLPWSAIIMDLYERGASSQHLLSSEIRGAHQLTALRFIENKYCFEECADEDDLLLLVERILYVNELEAMKDIHKVIGAQPEMESCIYRTALCHYIHQGNFEKCINIIYNLADIDSRTGLCLYVIQMCEIILQTKKPLNKPELSFFEFLNFVKQESLCVNEKNLNKIEVFEKIVKLKTKYDIHFNYGDYYHHRSGFEEVLNELIPKIINNYQGFDEIFASLQEIAYLCDIKLEVVLIELCKQTLNLGLILHCIGKLLVTQTIYNSTDNKREKFVVLAAHLVNIYGREDINMQNFLLENNIMHGDLDLVYPYALQLMNLHCCCSEWENDSSPYFLFYKWICIGAEDADDYLMETNQGHDVKLPSVTTVYRDASTLSDGRNVRKIISLMISNIFSTNFIGSEFNPVFKGSSSSCLNLLTKFPSNRLLTQLRIIQLLNIHNDGSISREHLQSLIPPLIEKTLLKMTARSKFDISNSLAVLKLSNSPDEVCEKLMTMLSGQPLRQLNIASLAQEFQKVIGSYSQENYFNLVFNKKCCNWAIKLKNMNLCVPDATTSSKNWHLHVLKKLYTLPATYSLLQEFCKDFQMEENLDSVLIQQLVYYLSKLKLQIKSTPDKILKQGLVVQPSEQEINRICSDYTIKLNNTKLIGEMEQLIPMINLYDYEIYMAVLNILKTTGHQSYSNWLEILKFLKSYTRNVPFGQIEHEAWTQCHSDDISPLAKYRMPFLCVMDAAKVFEIIKHEVDVSSCKRWLDIAHNLPLNESQRHIKDRLCQYAIKNTMLKIYQPSLSQEWSLSMVEKETREECYEILNLIKDVERYSAVMYFIMNYSRPGADLVAASKICYDYAVNCTDQKIKTSVEKMLRKYPMYATKHILTSNNLNEDYLLQLLEKPQELIFALYDHPIVLNCAGFTMNDTPDINKVVQQIAELHKSIDLRTLKHNLINQWLQASNLASNLDDSITMHSMVPEKGDTALDSAKWDDNLTRACYVLKSYDRKTVIELLGTNLETSVESVPVICRLRALRCMIKVCGLKYIEETMYLDRLQVQKLIGVLTTRHYLECIGLSYSMDDYNKINKESLVQYLLKNFNNNTIAISFCVQICQNNKIITEKIWDDILESLISFGMIKELQSALTWLRTYPNLNTLPVIKKAWQFIIKMPFVEADVKRNPAQEKSCATALLNLQCCPVAESIDLLDLAECCIKADRPYMAAALLPLANDEDKESLLKLIRSKSSREDLETNVTFLEELGILFVPQILHILKTY